jgi:hypothetical protein
MNRIRLVLFNMHNMHLADPPLCTVLLHDPSGAKTFTAIHFNGCGGGGGEGTPEVEHLSHGLGP